MLLRAHGHSCGRKDDHKKRAHEQIKPKKRSYQIKRTGDNKEHTIIEVNSLIGTNEKEKNRGPLPINATSDNISKISNFDAKKKKL